MKKEPRDQLTNFESNYFPYIEFYEEDFPWRYTPAVPDETAHRLRPWLALVVLTEEEFDDAALAPGQPLAAFSLAAAVESVFAPADQLWAWAHVHVNADLGADAGHRPRRRGRLSARGRLAERRPRVLPAPLPAGPRAGHRLPRLPRAELRERAAGGARPGPGTRPAFATQSAWASRRPAAGAVYPYYHRWYFRTGASATSSTSSGCSSHGRPTLRVGRRDMDVQRPGSNLTGIEIPELGGVLRLGGALQVPAEALTDDEEAEAERFEEWDTPFPHPFQSDLADLVNLAADYQGAADDPDPLVTPPIYGRWHALVRADRPEARRVPATRWRRPTHRLGHEANLDPRFRVAAGYGTRVLQEHQEDYMDAAWAQVGDVLAANRRIRLARTALSASSVWYSSHLLPLRDLSAERALMVTAPLYRRVVSEGPSPRSSGRAPSRRHCSPHRCAGCCGPETTWPADSASARRSGPRGWSTGSTVARSAPPPRGRHRRTCPPWRRSPRSSTSSRHRDPSGHWST